MGKALRCCCGCSVTLSAVTALGIAVAWPPLWDWLRVCIDPVPRPPGQENTPMPHPWNNRGRGEGGDCFDSRLTRLTRWLSAVRWVPEVHNNRDRQMVQNVLTKSECQRIIELGTRLGKGFNTDGRVGTHAPGSYYHESGEFRSNKLFEMIQAADGEPETQRFLAETLRRILRKVRSLFGDECVWLEHCDASRRTPPRPPNSTKESWTLRLGGGHPMHSDAGLWGGDPWFERPWVIESAMDNYRNLSAILYLNGDFKGGEFYILDSTRWAPWLGAGAHYLFSYFYVKPSCGTLVTYRNYNDFDGSNGEMNAHGTFAVEAGTRYTWGFWFTNTESRRCMKLDAELNRVLGPEKRKCKKPPPAPPNRPPKREPLQTNCPVEECHDSKYPYLDWDDAKKECVCKPHPCQGLVCNDPSMGFLVYQDWEQDESMRCRCRAHPCEGFSCKSRPQTKMRFDIHGNCWCEPLEAPPSARQTRTSR